MSKLVLTCIKMLKKSAKHFHSSMYFLSFLVLKMLLLFIWVCKNWGTVGWLVAWLSNYVWSRRKKRKIALQKQLVAGSSWEAEKNPFKWLLKDVPSGTVNNEWISWHNSHENNKTKIKPYYQATVAYFQKLQCTVYWLILITFPLLF